MAKIKTTEGKSINYIPLIDNYFYSADNDNYTLYYFNRRNKIDLVTKQQTGDILETYDTVGYYSSLETLLTSAIFYLNRKSISEGKIKTLKDCVEQIINAKNKLTSMLK